MKWLKHQLRKMVPYKGFMAWESQFGPVVIMWVHTRYRGMNWGHGIKIGRLFIWHDDLWR